MARLARASAFTPPLAAALNVVLGLQIAERSGPVTVPFPLAGNTYLLATGGKWPFFTTTGVSDLVP